MTYELEAKQILREKEQNSLEFKKWKDALAEQEKKSDGSNTPIPTQWEKAVLDNIVEGIQKEIDNPEFNCNGEATRAVQPVAALRRSPSHPP